MTIGCPCGSQRQSGQEVIQYIERAMLDNLVPSTQYDTWIPVLSWIIGRPVDWDQACSQPPPQPPDAIVDWFENPLGFLSDIYDLVIAIGWPSVCECIDCPPATDCNTGTSFSVSVANAYLEIGPSCGAYKYHLTDADVYAAVDGFTCCGHFTGDVYVQWNAAQDEVIAPGPVYGCGGVTDRTVSINGSGGGESCTRVTGDDWPNVTIWVNTSVGPPSYPWPDDPAVIEPEPDPPSCTEESQCQAIDYLGTVVTELIWHSALFAQRQISQTIAIDTLTDTVESMNGPYSVELPGLSGPITGTLSTVLPRLMQALAPPTSEQLVEEWIEVVDGSGTIDLTGMAGVELHLSSVPASYGTFDSQAPAYWNKGIQRGPGVVTLRGDHGVLRRVFLQESTGTWLPVDPLATEMTYDLAPGVEVTATGYTREV